VEKCKCNEEKVMCRSQEWPKKGKTEEMARSTKSGG